FPPGWDTGNGLLWTYLFQSGWLPYRDFWYPYGGIIWSSSVFPWNFILANGYCALVLITSLLSFYLITDRSLARALAIFAIWFGLAVADVFPIIRYAIVVPFIFSYLCASHERGRVKYV